MNYNLTKQKFALHFESEILYNPKFRFLMYDIFVYGSAYIVGGYLRDFLISKPSRDMDIIVDISHDKLVKIISNSNVPFKINRYNGIKLKFKNIEVDIWSIENNWAFKNELVKLNEDDKLNSIVKGCFYNYDALAVNIHTLNLNIKYYSKFIKEKKLDILQKSPVYMNLNPTIEANILRAFYLKKIYNIDFSSKTKKYLIDKIGEIKDLQLSPILELENTKLNYKKYQKVLSRYDIEKNIKELYKGNLFDGQTYIEF